MAVTNDELRRLADANDPTLPPAYGQFVVEARDLALALGVDVASDIGLARDLDLTRTSNRDLARDLARDLVRAIDNDLAHPRAPDPNSELDVDARLGRDLGVNVELVRSRGLTHAIALSRETARDLVRDLVRSLSSGRAHDAARARDLARDLAGRIEVLVPGAEVKPTRESFFWKAAATLIYVLLGVPYPPLEGEAADAPKRQDGALGGAPLSGMVNLVVNPSPSSDRVASFKAMVEALLGQAQRLIDEGAFDSDPMRLELVERDRNFIRDEVYGTDEPFQLGETLGAIIARLDRNLLSVSDIPAPTRALLDRVIDTTSHDASADVGDVLDDVIDEARLDDPDWLAEQPAFDAYALQIQEIAEVGARRWLAGVAGWWPTPGAREIRSEAAGGVTIGMGGGGAISLIVAAFTSASLGNAVAAGSVGGGVAGAILAVSLTWFFARYRNELPSDSPDDEQHR